MAAGANGRGLGGQEAAPGPEVVDRHAEVVREPDQLGEPPSRLAEEPLAGLLLGDPQEPGELGLCHPVAGHEHSHHTVGPVLDEPCVNEVGHVPEGNALPNNQANWKEQGPLAQYRLSL